jgi:hypothetical protein
MTPILVIVVLTLAFGIILLWRTVADLSDRLEVLEIEFRRRAGR